MDRKFFICPGKLHNSEIIDGFSNILSRSHNLLSLKKHRYYVSVIKRYRMLGFLTSKTIKLNIMNEIEDDFIK